MALSKNEIRRLRDVIVALYDRKTLKHTIHRYMDVNYDEIVGGAIGLARISGPFSESIKRDIEWNFINREVESLVKWADENSKLTELLEVLIENAPSGSDLARPRFEAPLTRHGTLPVPQMVALSPAPITPGSKKIVFRRKHRVRAIRIDAAVPSQVCQKAAFTLAVAVRNPWSAILHEADLTKVASGDAFVEEDSLVPYVRLRIEVLAPDCWLSNSSITFRWYLDNDTPIYMFSLVPLTSGQISIIVQLYQEVDCIGTTSVRTRVSEQQPVGRVHLVIDSDDDRNIELVGQQILAFRDALVAAFNEQGLQELVTVYLHENLEAVAGGANLNAIAFNLIEWAQRYGRTHELVRSAWLANPYNHELRAFRKTVGI